MFMPVNDKKQRLSHFYFVRKPLLVKINDVLYLNITKSAG